jgi:hypothetical protein
MRGNDPDPDTAKAQSRFDPCSTPYSYKLLSNG